MKLVTSGRTALIEGNRDELVELRYAINEALRHGRGEWTDDPDEPASLVSIAVRREGA